MCSIELNTCLIELNTYLIQLNKEIQQTIDINLSGLNILFNHFSLVFYSSILQK